MQKIKPSWVAAALLIVAAVAAVVVLRRGPKGPPPLKIGVMLPLSGPDAKIGRGLLGPIRLAVDEVNGRGGVLGRPVRIVEYDDASSPEKAQANARAALADPALLALIGNYDEQCAIQTNEIYGPKSLANVTVGAVHRELTHDLAVPGTARINPNDREVIRVAMRHAWDVLGARRFILARDESDQIGWGFAVLADETLRQAHPESERVELALRAGATDLDPMVLQIKARAAQYVLFAGPPKKGAELLLKLRAAGVKSEFAIAAKAPPAEFIEAAKDKAEGVFTSFAGLPPEYTAEGRAFLERYKAAGIEDEPGPYALFAYAGAQTVLLAMAQSQLERVSLAQALKRGVFPTVLGPIQFKDKGQSRYDRIAVYKVSGGRWVPVFVNDSRQPALTPVTGPLP